MRTCLLLVSLASLGCFSPKYDSGQFKCSPGSHPCPDGYCCASDNTCWQNGKFPPDMSPPASIDMAGMPALDMTILSYDMAFTSPLVHVSVGGGAGIAAQVAGTHRATFSVGQPIAGPSPGTNHQVQFGVLRGTTAK
jgi:hypothetical protein